MKRRYREFLRENENIDIPRTTLNRWRKRSEAQEEELLISEDCENGSDVDRCTEQGTTHEPIDSSESECDSTSADQYSINSRTSEDERMSDVDAYGYENSENDKQDPTWITQTLYPGSENTIGQAVEMILDYYLKNALTKKSLEGLLKMLANLLPQPNSLPKTKYLLSQLLDPLLISHAKAIKKHRFCNDCSRYLGDWFADPIVSTCDACQSLDVGSMFVEYDIRSLLIDAFQVRDLDIFIDMHTRTNNQVGDQYISDITDGTEYKKLKKDVITGDYDVCLLWNTDGIPTSNSSNGQLWPIQVQIVNVPPTHRRAFQFVCGLYYSTVSKPNMNSFLKPFADAMKNLYISGIDWYQARTESMIHSKVIAPIATLDCPARAAVQNVVQFNGEYGCSFCEHPGETCRTGSGFNHVYRQLDSEPPMRTNEKMLAQGSRALQVGAKHVKGVKGPTIVSIIPFFNIAISFVPDYMHAILLGVLRMLITCWCDSRNKNRPYYVKKSLRRRISKLLEQITPPDGITRVPRDLKNFKFWKASELRAFLLLYSAILLNGILPTIYYQHYLLLVRATHILLQSRIHVKEVDLAETLLYLFVSDIQNLYGLEKCSFNVHQLTHLATFVRYWGPLWAWSAFPFEDGNGYLTRIRHGPNKIDTEIFNTLKYVHALHSLRHRLNFFPDATKLRIIIPLGSPVIISIGDTDLRAFQNIPSFKPNDICTERVHVYARVKVGNEVFTSEIYTRQKKRDNCNIIWNEGSMLGAIKYFIRIDGTLFAIVQKCMKETDKKHSIIHRDTEMCFDACIKPIRNTYCVQSVPIDQIEGKFLRLKNYACILPNAIEKKL